MTASNMKTEEKPKDGVVTEEICEKVHDPNIGTDFTFKRQIVWRNVIGFIILHLYGLYGAYLVFTAQSKALTAVWTVLIGWLAGEGVTIGAHRMWTHRGFRGSLSVRIAMMIFQTLASQNCLWVWIRDHRQHHRYADTDGDPHNSTRGFFFSHMGWLMSKKHPLIFKLGKNINMDDLNADKVVMFQKKHFYWLYALIGFLFPVIVPVYLWNETWFNSVMVSFFFRLVLVWHITWSVNSVTHLYGYKPYDKSIAPVESALISFLSSGEGWHNYHHVFPWDYKTAEFGTPLQLSSYIIEALNHFGLAYDLKKVTPDIIKSRAERTGDHNYSHTIKAQ